MGHRDVAAGTAAVAGRSSPAAELAVPAQPLPGAVNEAVRCRPAPALRPFIAYYSGYRQEGVGPARHRGLPSPHLTLIFTLDEPLTIAAHPDPGQPPGVYGALLGGLHSSPALITHDGRQSGIQVALRPAAARPLLGLPAGELAGIDVAAAEVLGPMAGQIQDRIRAAASWPDRFAVVDQVLLARLRNADDGAALGARSLGARSLGARSLGARSLGTGSLGTGPLGTGPLGAEVGHAWRELLRTRGAVSVSGLAVETGWSERHLRSRFLAETGLTPKAAARVIRFDWARRQTQRRSSAGTLVLADLAADCGYYDQAHLAREFRALAGCAPTEWLAQEFRNVQAAPEPVLSRSSYD